MILDTFLNAPNHILVKLLIKYADCGQVHAKNGGRACNGKTTKHRKCVRTCNNGKVIL